VSAIAHFVFILLGQEHLEISGTFFAAQMSLLSQCQSTEENTNMHAES